MPNLAKIIHHGRRKEERLEVPSANRAPLTPTASLRPPSRNSSQQIMSSTPCQTQLRGANTAISTPESRRDLWEEAYQKLCSKEKDLVARYEEILLREESIDLADTGDTAQTAGNPPPHVEAMNKTMSSHRLTTLAQKKLDIIEKERWNSSYYEKALKIIIIAKDFIGSAVTTEPHGALAWAGVSLLLPLLLNPSQQQSDVANGIEQIPDIIARYQLYEENLPLKQILDAAEILYDNSSQLCTRFLSRTVDLYAIVLEYQARAICQFSRHTIHRYGRDIFKADNWQNLLADIRTVDSDCEKMSAAIGNGMAKKALEKQDHRLNNLLKDFQDAKARSITKEHRKCHQALYFDYSAQKERNPSRVPETCEWFLQNSVFREWRDNFLSPLLWVSADPGCGKSVLSKTLIDEQLLGIDPAATKVCYFFFKDNAPENRDAKTAIAAIIHQLFSHDSRLIRHALPRYEKVGKQLAGSFSEMWSILESAVTDLSSGNIVCLLDAFDECDPEGQKQLIGNLSRLFGDPRQRQSEARMALKFIITSRPYNEIIKGFSNFLAIGSMIELAGNENSARISEEISLVIRAKIPDLADKLGLDNEAQNYLREALLKVENKTYLWLYLMFNALEESVGISTAKAIKKFTERVPSSVEDAYETMLRRSPDQEKARTLLYSLLGAVRPLTVPELKIALAIKGSEESLDDMEFETDENFKKTARTLCGLLISFFDSKAYWLHQTAKEFLLQKSGERSSCGWGHTFQQNTAELQLCTICIQYLFRCKLEDGPCDDDATMERRLEGNPFLQYASENWGIHAKREGERQNLDIILRLLSSESRVLSMIQAMTFRGLGEEPFDLEYPTSSTYVHLIAYFGLSFVLRSACSRNKSLISNVMYRANDDGETPLALAAMQGHETVVKMLLEQPDININSRDKWGLTPLTRATCLRQGNPYGEELRGHWKPSYEKKTIWRAEGNGHESIVKLLLENKDIQPELEDKRGDTTLAWAAKSISKDDQRRTPLMHAVQGGFEDIVKLLLEREDVDVNSEDLVGNTPLSSAAGDAYEAIVKLLLERRTVDVNSKEIARRPPLFGAARSGNEVITKLLRQQRGINADWTDYNGRTPLSYAVERGNESVVRLILQRVDVNADSEDKDGRTPLSYAVERGNETVVRLLLQRHNVNAESKDNKGRTLLSWAALGNRDWCREGEGCDREAVVRLLLGLDNVNPDTKDLHGRTPLSYAAECGNETVVRLLLQRHNVNAESKDNKGRTPLSLASEHGYEPVVSLLLQCHNVNTESKDNNGRTPLSLASEHGYEPVVRLLLQYYNVNTESKDNNGRTPLSWASEYGHEPVVRLLLKYHDVNAESKDNDGRTPLWWAAASAWERNDREAVVRLLLGLDNVNPDTKDVHGRTPLSWAAVNSNETIVKLLLKRDKVDAESKDAHGRTPLSWATENGQIYMIKLLLEQSNVNAGSKDENGRTPLSWLADMPRWKSESCDIKKALELLTEVDSANAEAEDSHGRTPLSRAAENGRAKMLKLLLEMPSVNVESKDENGRTPLSWLASSPFPEDHWEDFEETLRILIDVGGADMESEDGEGKTPLSRAIENNSERAVKLMLERTLRRVGC